MATGLSVREILSEDKRATWGGWDLSYANGMALVKDFNLLKKELDDWKKKEGQAQSKVVELTNLIHFTHTRD